MTIKLNPPQENLENQSQETKLRNLPDIFWQGRKTFPVMIQAVGFLQKPNVWTEEKTKRPINSSKTSTQQFVKQAFQMTALL